MFDKVLVPLDGSELAETALPLAIRLAGAGRLVLTRAIEAELMMSPVGFEFEVMYLEQNQTRHVEQARTYLEEVGRSCEEIETTIVTHVGDPASVILDTVEETEADLIVMTTHGYCGLTRWMLGSVTERVLRNAPCPVVVLRAEKPIQRILIPLDGSDLSEAILTPAFELAERLAAAVLLLHVDDSLSLVEHASLDALDQFEPGMAEQLRVSYANRSEMYLRDMRDRIDTSVPVKTLSVLGKAADEILVVAEREACDLIAMSTHGRSGVQRWVYGSVTEKVLRSGDTSLLIVRPN